MTQSSPQDTQAHAPAQAGASFDAMEFRKALGTFATGVTIITARAADGAPIGLTANSFNSVSLDPPLVLWSLANNAMSFDAFRAATHWAVHVLGSDQEDLSGRFARRGEDKFAGLEFDEGEGGVQVETHRFSPVTARFVRVVLLEGYGDFAAVRRITPES